MTYFAIFANVRIIGGDRHFSSYLYINY